MSKYDERYEEQVRRLALNRVETGNYKFFDHDARVVTRMNIAGKGNCLVMVNHDGETIVIDSQFELALKTALRIK